MLNLRFIKQNHTKIVALTLVMILLLSSSFTTAIAAEAIDNISTCSKFDVSETLYTAFSDKVQSMQKEETPLTIKRIITVRDFSNHKYTVIECAPTGYIIYHPDSGIFVESSPSAISPYINLAEDNLYYGGPTEYYIEKNGIYYHTVIDEVIDNPTDIDNMKLYSQRIESVLNGNKNIALLDYVINNDATAYATMTRISAYAVESGLSQDEINWFKNLKQCGYHSNGPGNGLCGFVALNILYSFFDKFEDDDFMDDKYWVDSTKTLLKNNEDSFTKYLYDLDPKSSTTSMHIHNVSKKYLKQKGITNIDHTSKYWGFFTKNTIKNLIKDGYPVILFGKLEDPPGYNGKKGGHAVVAYQYSGNDFVCHYGWDDCTEVTIVGTLGSIYAMEVK